MSFTCEITPNRNYCGTCKVKGHRTGDSNYPQRPTNRNNFLPEKVYRVDRKTKYKSAYPETSVLSQTFDPDKHINTEVEKFYRNRDFYQISYKTSKKEFIENITT